MSDPDRTAFATLLAGHRERLGLTQAALAARTDALRHAGRVPRAVTERTISALERLSRDRPRIPHHATVRSLALALELAPGTPEHDAFIAAAQDPTAVAVATPHPLAEPDAEFIAAGREPQLARLTDAIESAADGAPAGALLAGDAGSGKTRLLDEACRRALDRHPDAVVLWTTCPRGFGAMADREPFRSMLGQVVLDPLASGGGSLPEANENRLATRLPVVARALTGPAAPLVGTLLPRSALLQPTLLEALDPGLRVGVERLVSGSAARSATPNQIDTALWRLLAALASSGPVILVIEDLHWADAATLGAIVRVTRELALSRLPIALLGSIQTDETTPGEAGHGSELARLVDSVSDRFPGAVVDLAPTIGGEAGRAFVDAAVARLSLEPLAERLFARTSGMPLFVMSILRLHMVNGSAIDGRELPEEIDTVFRGQLARLDARSRAVLAAASVQGDEFLAEPALAVAGVPPEEGTRPLDHALGNHVRALRSQPIAPGTSMHRYRFVHAVMRDHVLSTLSDLERSRLHLAIAEALIGAVGAQDHDAVEAIAIQLEQGGDLARAVGAWVHAGDRAMLRADYLRAHELFRHARDLGVEDAAPGMHTQALIGIGNTYRALGHPREARQALDRALQEATRKALHGVAANALMSLGVIDFDDGRMVSGAARFVRAIDDYRRDGNIDEAARANANLSLALHGMGRYDEARARAERAIDMARESGNRAVLASAEIARANCWLDLGYYVRALAEYETGLVRYDADGLVHQGNRCLLNIALCHIESGSWAAAQAALDRLNDPGRKVVDRLRSAIAFDGAMVAEGRGDLAAAARGYETARAIRVRLGQEPLLIDSLAGLLRVAVATGDMPRARALLAGIERRVTERGYIGIEHLGRLFETMVEASRAIGDNRKSRAWLTRAVALLRERADRLADPEHRASYLTKPPAHRRILALAGAAGIAVPGLHATGR